MRQRIAFVFYPHAPDKVRLESMPFALNTVRALARSGWQVDVFLWQQMVDKSVADQPEQIRFRIPGWPELRLPKRLQPYLHAARYALSRSYALVFGLGQVGVHIGQMMARFAGCPLIYLNDEFPSCWPPSVWDRLESHAAARAALIATPDARRNPHLLEELGLTPHFPTSELYNTAELAEPLPEINWHARLGIAKDKQIVLHAGSVADWAQVPEVLATIDGWADDVVLVLHGRSKELGECYRKEMGHLDAGRRVVWFNEPLSEMELHSLIAASLACLGLYRNSGPNVELVGYSAGKIMRSLACGTPVIASDFGTLSFIAEERLGFLVRHPAEIASRLATLSGSREEFRRRCLAFAEHEIAFAPCWKRFVSDVDAACGLDLTGPHSGTAPYSPVKR